MIRPASTVVLLRDGSDGVEVFMVRRHGKSGFMAGATVFPGGKVDAIDGPVEAPEGRAASAFFLAALRELHEEACVLFALDAAGDRVDDVQAATLRAPLAAIRDGHRVDAAAHMALLDERGWRFDIDAVVPFARWITPEIEPRRFDTWFFAAAAPARQVAEIDGFEHTASSWMRPSEALADHNGGGAIWLPPPTYHTLLRLAAIPGSAAQVVNALRSNGPIPGWMPHFIADTPEGPVVALPDDPLHPEFDAESVDADTEPRHRFVLNGGRFRYDRRGLDG